MQHLNLLSQLHPQRPYTSNRCGQVVVDLDKSEHRTLLVKNNSSLRITCLSQLELAPLTKLPMPHVALPYEEPQLVNLLVLTSFLYFLNVARMIGDFLLYAVIIAEIFLGIIYGSPLAKLLPIEWETTFTALGYLGLILVVFEGMNLISFSSAVALTAT